MANIQIKTYIRVATSNGIKYYGSETNPVEIALDGDGRVHNLSWDGVDTSSNAVTIYDSSSSSLPSGAKIFFVKANVDGKIQFDDGTSNAITSSVPVKAGLWQAVGGTQFNVVGSSTTAATRATESGTVIDRITYKADSGTSADVEILGVY